MERALLSDLPAEVGSLLCLDAQPCAGESDTEIVAASWDFGDLNQRYRSYERVLNQRPASSIKSETQAKLFSRWLCEEREAWTEALSRDPLLPESLLPPEYAGRQAWRHRQEAMAQAGEQMRGFKLCPGISDNK